jgi:hypothetical protein
LKHSSSVSQVTRVSKTLLVSSSDTHKPRTLALYRIHLDQESIGLHFEPRSALAAITQANTAVETWETDTVGASSLPLQIRLPSQDGGGVGLCALRRRTKHQANDCLPHGSEPLENAKTRIPGLFSVKRRSLSAKRHLPRSKDRQRTRLPNLSPVFI